MKQNLENRIEETNAELDRRGFLKKLGAIVAGTILFNPLYANNNLENITTKNAINNAVTNQTIIKNYSPRTPHRSNRKNTSLVVYHQTEAGDKSSHNSVLKDGTCNYLIESNGKIYEIIPHNKLSKHAGISYWKGKGNVSNFSIGIEIVGTHTNPPNQNQLEALKYLNKNIKQNYPNLKDEDFVTHSMVATLKRKGKTYRGRRWCAMTLNNPDIRAKMGLYNRTTADPDKIAFFPWYPNGQDLSAILYGHKTTPDIPSIPTPKPKIPDEKNLAFGLINLSKSKTAYSIAGKDYDTNRSIYFIPTIVCGKTVDTIKRGDELKKSDFQTMPTGTRMLYGYIDGGHISKDRSAYSICKEDWKDPRTVYRFATGEMITGDKINTDAIPPKTRVFFLED